MKSLGPRPLELAAPPGFEPVAFGSGGRRKEATWGSVEPLLLNSFAFCQTRDHARLLRAVTDCQSFVSRPVRPRDAGAAGLNHDERANNATAKFSNDAHDSLTRELRALAGKRIRMTPAVS